MQPCDVGIQRPFKLSVKRSYQEDIVTEMVNQLGNEESGSSRDSSALNIDTRLPVLRDKSTRWIWNAYKAVSRKELVKMVTHPSKFLIHNTHKTIRHSKTVLSENGTSPMIA